MIGGKFKFGWFGWFLSVLRVVRQVQTESDAGFPLPQGARDQGFRGRLHEAAVGAGRGVFQPAFGRKWQLLGSTWRRGGAKRVVAVHLWRAAQSEVSVTGTGLWVVPLHGPNW